MKLKLILAFAAIFGIWGSTYLAIKYAVETIPPFMMMGVRSLVAGSVLFWWSRRSGFKVSRQEWPALLIISILFFVLGHGLLAWGQLRVPSGLAAVLIASDPLWIALIESFSVPGFRIRPKQAIGLLCGFGGIALLFIPLKGWSVTHIDPLAAGLILFSAIAWSFGAVYSRVAKLPKSPALAAGIELIIGGALLVVIAFVLGEFKNFYATAISVRSALAFGYLVIFGSIITFTAYIFLLSVTSATKVATHTYVNPVIAVFLGWVFAGEQLTIPMLIAAAVIVLSVYLVLKRK